jgi:hypothetical protein
MSERDSDEALILVLGDSYISHLFYFCSSLIFHIQKYCLLNPLTGSFQMKFSKSREIINIFK